MSAPDAESALPAPVSELPAAVVLTVSPVCSASTTSISCITGTGLKKCMPMT